MKKIIYIVVAIIDALIKCAKCEISPSLDGGGGEGGG